VTAAPVASTSLDGAPWPTAGRLAAAGVLVALPVILGTEFLLSLLAFDMAATPAWAIHLLLSRSEHGVPRAAQDAFASIVPSVIRGTTTRKLKRHNTVVGRG
jgi:hypothetical protein